MNANVNENKLHGCKCRNCGVEFITQSKSADTYCRFCGAPALLAEDFEIDGMPELSRKITAREYNAVLDTAMELGIERLFTQERSSGSTDYIPSWDF